MATNDWKDPSGEFALPSNDVALSSGSAKSSSDVVALPSHHVVMPSGNVALPSNHVAMPSGNVALSSNHVATTQNDRESRQLNYKQLIFNELYNKKVFIQMIGRDKKRGLARLGFWKYHLIES